MTEFEFVDFAKEVMEHELNTLHVKAEHYTANNDRFHNFIIASAILDVLPSQVAWSFAVKHLVRFIDIINRRQSYTPADLRECIGDLRNYLLLIEGMLLEEQS